MYPVLFSIGGYAVRSYSVLLFLGIAIGICVCYCEARRVGLDAQAMLVFCSTAIIAGLMGARAWYVVTRWPLYRSDPWRVLAVWENGGLVSFGGALAAVVWAVLYARRARFRIWVLLDLIASAIVLVEAVMRWGCLLNGCCFGWETSSPLGMYLPDSHGVYAYRYPTQVVQSLVNGGIFVILWRLRRKPPFDGFIFACYLVLYFTGRFILAFWRADDIPVWGLFTQTHLASLGIVLGTLTVLLVRRQVSQHAVWLETEGV
jgi:phosphatidylglycerol:prolipoprotein diacylglycerol transferase